MIVMKCTQKFVSLILCVLSFHCVIFLIINRISVTPDYFTDTLSPSYLELTAFRSVYKT